MGVSPGARRRSRRLETWRARELALDTDAAGPQGTRSLRARRVPLARPAQERLEGDFAARVEAGHAPFRLLEIFQVNLSKLQRGVPALPRGRRPRPPRRTGDALVEGVLAASTRRNSRLGTLRRPASAFGMLPAT